LPTDPALFWTRSNAFLGGSASYSITGIPIAGTYTAYAFIDMNANAPDNSTAMPDSGDYYLQAGQQISISGNQTLNLGPSGWITTSNPDAWIIGSWGPLTYAPYSNLCEITANGKVYIYDNYDGTGLLLCGSWSPSAEGPVLTILGEQHVATEVSDNEFSIAGHESTYRKNYAPVASIFSKTGTELSPGVMTEGTVAPHDMQLYTFTASSTGNYMLSWEAYGIGVAAYKSDQATSLFIHEGAHSLLETIALGAGEKIFVIVDGATGWGTFRVMVQPRLADRAIEPRHRSHTHIFKAKGGAGHE